MQGNVVSCSLEQFGHLSLRKPHSIILQPNFEPHGLVGLVEDYFTLLLFLLLNYLVRHIPFYSDNVFTITVNNLIIMLLISLIFRIKYRVILFFIVDSV